MVQRMARVNLFRSDFFVSRVGNEDQITNLKQQMLVAQENNVDKIANSNDRCWRSTVKYDGIDWLLDGVKTLAEEAIDYYSNLDSTFKEHIVERHINLDYWSNINKPASKNVLHSHVADSFAAVYYIQGTKTGPLKFINPANVLNDCNTISPFVREVLVHPHDGELILWPAWVPHEVEVNQSDRDRMNVAFTLQVT
jgi:uncharacterized protein (TIGR02466 family)